MGSVPVIFTVVFASASVAYIVLALREDVRARRWWRACFGLFAVLFPLWTALVILWVVGVGQGTIETTVKPEVRVSQAVG